MKGRMKAAAPERIKDERGICMIIVLWVMALLMVITTGFIYTMRVEGAAARNYTDEIRAYYLSLAGINLGIAEVSERFDIAADDGNGRLVFLKKNGGRAEEIKSTRELELTKGKIKYSIHDELGKLNLNTASREQIAGLVESTGVEEAERDIIADSILDWRDEDQDYHLNGAEEDYYISRPLGYASKDGLFDTVEELLLVRGVTPAVFYGSGRIPPEFGAEAKPFFSRNFTGLSRRVTVNGNGKVNLNTADEKVLEAVFGKAASKEIKSRREAEGFFETPSHGGAVTSNMFTIYSEGEAGGLKFRIKAIVERHADPPQVTVRYWNEEVVNPD